MSISRVEIRDFLVFKGDFATDFCSGVNVIIGGNGTGKTTLLKIMYTSSCYASPLYNQKSDFVEDFFVTSNYNSRSEKSISSNVENSVGECQVYFDNEKFGWLDAGMIYHFDAPQKDMANSEYPYIKSVMIPTAEMLSHAKGFLALCRERQMPFDAVQIDILSKAEIPETLEVSAATKKVLDTITDIIEGVVVFHDGAFFVKKNNGELIPFSLEASGFQKLGLLWKLLRNGFLEKGNILFWDEPEASINPELMPKLVEILLGLQRGGLQIFLATHSEILASYFDVLRDNNDEVIFYSLFKEEEQIKSEKNERFGYLRPNTLTAEQVKLYECEVERGLG
jgi:AAA15 family ATPase/GTPase